MKLKLSAFLDPDNTFEYCIEAGLNEDIASSVAMFEVVNLIVEIDPATGNVLDCQLDNTPRE